METSIYSTTEDHTKSARLARAVVDICGDIYRYVLTKYIKPEELRKLLGKVPFEEIQIRLIKNASSTGYGAFDLTLLYKLLCNVPGIAPPKKGWKKTPSESDVSESDDIKRINDLRNDAYGHIASTKEPGKDWDKYWSELEGVCERMDRRFTNTTFRQDLEFIKTCPMDEQMEKMYKERLKELNEKEFELTSRISVLEDAIKENENFMENIQRIEKMTLLEIQEHKRNLYVKREKIEGEILRMLSRPNTGVCIVSGKPGFGKTRICFEILSHFTYEFNSEMKTYILKEPTEWKRILASEDAKVILIEDFLGKTNLDENLLQGWESHFTSMEAVIKKGNNAIMFSSRDELLQLASQKLTKYGIFNSHNVICISSKEFLMTKYQKRRMINAYSIRFEHEICKWMDERLGGTDSANFLLSHKDIEDISHTDPLDGFPQACYLFFTNVNFYMKKLDFFSNAADSVSESINMLYSPDDSSMYMQYLLLVMLMLKNGEYPLADLTIDDLKPLCDDLDVLYLNTVFLQKAVRRLEKSYIKKSTSELTSYSFTHESIMETVLLSFGKHFLESLLRNADQKVLYNFVRSSHYERREREICIVLPEVWNEDLAERVSRAKNMSVANHPSRTDPKFVRAVLEHFEYAIAEKKVDNPKAVLEDNLIALCKNKGHVFLEALVDRMLKYLNLYPIPSWSVLQDCLLECVLSSDLFSLKQILKVLDIIPFLNKEDLTIVLKEAVRRHSNNIDIIKNLLQTTEDRQIVLDLAIHALNLYKWKLVRWMSLKSIKSDPLQSVFSFILLNSISYAKHDVTRKLLALKDISQDVYDDALELASILPDSATFKVLANLKLFQEIPLKTLLNLIWRSCLYKKDEVLDLIILKSDMSNVTLDIIVEMIHTAHFSEENTLELSNKISESNFMPDLTRTEKQKMLSDTLAEKETLLSDPLLLKAAFEMSAAELKDSVHLRNRRTIISTIQKIMELPIPICRDNARENISKSLLLAFLYGMADMRLEYDKILEANPLVSGHVDAIVMVCVHDNLNGEIMSLLEQGYIRHLQDQTAEVLYLHGSCARNEHLVRKLKEKFEFEENILQTRALLATRTQNQLDTPPIEIWQKALCFTVCFESKDSQNDLLNRLDLSNLSKHFIVDLLQKTILRSTGKLIVSLLKVVCPTACGDEMIEEAFCLAVKFREAAIVEDFISIVGKNNFSQRTMCTCIEESLEQYSEEMRALLVHTFGKALLTSENVTQTIRYGSSEFLDVVLQNSTLSQSNIYDGIFVSVCCEELDAIQTLVNATHIDERSKRRIREDLLRMEPSDVVNIFQSLESHFQNITPSQQVKEEQLLQAFKNKKETVAQAILLGFPEPPISFEVMEVAFKDALGNRDERSIALILSTSSIMDNPVVAKFAVEYAIFNYMDILPALLGERCFSYSVLQEAIQNVILTGEVRPFETLIDHLEKHSLKADQVADIFQCIFINYRETVAEVFCTKLDTSILQCQTARNIVKATIFRLLKQMSGTTMKRLKDMHVPNEIINETLLEFIVVSLLSRNVIHAKNSLAYLDTELTSDDKMLSVLYMMLQNRMFDLFEYVLHNWDFKECKSNKAIVKIALSFNAYPLLDTIFNKMSGINDELVVYVVSETLQRKRSSILKSLLSKEKVKYETVLSLYFLCISLGADDMVQLMSDMYGILKCDITLGHKENALMFSIAMKNIAIVSSVLSSLKEEMSSMDNDFFRTFLQSLQETFNVEEVTSVLKSLNPLTMSSKLSLEVLNWSLRESDMPTIQYLFSMYELPNEDCLTLKENAIKRFGPMEESVTKYSKTSDKPKWPQWLLAKYLGIACTPEENTASGNGSSTHEGEASGQSNDKAT